MKALRKPGKLALLALVLIPLVTWLAWPGNTPDPVLTATVTRQDVEQTVLASGVLQAIEQVDVGPRSRVRSPISRWKRVSRSNKELLAEIDP